MALQALVSASVDSTEPVNMETPNTVVTAKLVTLPTSAQLTGSIDVPMEGKAIKVSVPMTSLAAIYEQAGISADEPVGIVVTALKEGTVESAASGQGPNGGSISLAAPPVSVDVALLSSGNSIGVSGLSQPIMVTVGSKLSSGCFCAFFDEDAGVWSSEGVETVISADDAMECATTHLSLFGAIFEEFGKAIACSNAKLLSEKGLRQLGKGDWWRSLPAILLWALSVLLCVTNVLAVHRDMHWKRVFHWKDEHFFVSTPDSEMWTTKQCFAVRAYHQLRDAVVDRFQWFASLVKGPVNTVTDSIVTSATKNSLASNNQIHRDDMDSHIWRRGDWVDDTQFQRAESFQSKVSQVYASSPEQYQIFFKKASFFTKVKLIFFAIQPLATLSQFSLVTPASIRAQLLTAEINGALFLSALFYQASGSAMSSESDDECTPASDFRAFLRSMIIGFISSLLSAWPIAAFASLHSRGFRYASHWDEIYISHYLRKWFIEDCILFFFTVSYNIFCVFFIAVFLANVDSASYGDWLWSAASSVLDNLIITPIKYALAVTILATIVQVMIPHHVHRNAVRLGLDSESKIRIARSKSNLEEVSKVNSEERSSTRVCIDDSESSHEQDAPMEDRTARVDCLREQYMYDKKLASEEDAFMEDRIAREQHDKKQICIWLHEQDASMEDRTEFKQIDQKLAEWDKKSSEVEDVGKKHTTWWSKIAAEPNDNLAIQPRVADTSDKLGHLLPVSSLAPSLAHSLRTSGATSPVSSRELPPVNNVNNVNVVVVKNVVVVNNFGPTYVASAGSPRSPFPSSFPAGMSPQATAPDVPYLIPSILVPSAPPSRPPELNPQPYRTAENQEDAIVLL